MHRTQYIVQVDEEVAQTIQADAQRLKIPATEVVSKILTAHHEEYRRFPDGVLRLGRQKIIALLSQIPCLSKFDSSGIDLRYWWVSFDVDEASPIASIVIRQLAYLLNTQSAEMMLPTILKPHPPELPGTPIKWILESTQARFDPSEVEIWLRDHLPHPLSEPNTWLRLNETANNPALPPPIPLVRLLPDTEDCEKVGQKHKWFNVDDVHSACYNCRVVRQGQLWR